MNILGLGVWQSLLDGIGWVLARIYDVIPNYGVAIIILTILIRLLLLPLGIKQIKSMQHMQAIQPKIKELQKKYKTNKQKQQEETMKLYREAGVNPLGGCLPLLLQFPILIAMYSVLRAPVPNANVEAVQAGTEPAYVNNHLPEDSSLYEAVTQHNGSGTSFLFMNLQCSLVQSGTQAQVTNSARQPAVDESGQPVTLDCGDSKFPDVIPYAALLLVMIGTTFYQQRQMQKASPPNAQSSQQQAIMRFLPLTFAFFGLSFPAGLVLYWTTSNVFQIAQQTFLLRAGHIGPDALEKRMAEQRARQAEPAQPGFFGRLMERAQGVQEERDGMRSKAAPKPASNGKAGRRPSGKRPPSKTPPNPANKRPATKKPPPAQPPPSGDGDG